MKHFFWALLSTVLLCSCATTNVSPVTSRGFSFEEDEKRIWARVEEQQDVLDKSGFIYEDEELEAYLNDVAKKIFPVEATQHFSPKIKVIKNHYLNAFAYPNGATYIHTGILARMENEAQLASVLAHEITHATHRHSLKESRDLKNKTAFLATIQVTVGGMGGGIGDLVNLIGQFGTMAAITGYSRELETEADMEGFRLTRKAGYDTREAQKIFLFFKEERKEEEKEEPFFWGSHPKLQNRIDNYERLNRSQTSHGNIINADIFLEKTHNVVLDNAYLALQAGRFERSKKGAEKYIKIKPNDAKGHYLLGKIFHQRGKEDDTGLAIEQFQKALSLNPAFPDPHKDLGLIYLKQGKNALARDAFEAYLKLSPDACDKGYIKQYLERCAKEGKS